MTEPRPASLKRRLVLLLLGVVTLAWVLTAAVSYVDANHEIDELLDAHLAQSAALLVTQVGHELEEIDTEHAPQVHKYGRRVAFQIWEGGEVLRLHSVGAPDGRLSTTDEGFSDAVIAGQQWRVYSNWDADGRFLVQVGEQHGVRDQIAAKIARNLLAPLLFALPALGLLIWFSVAQGVKPLAALGKHVAERDPGNLAPLPTGDAPDEVRPLVENLNRLFERVRASIDNERRFTADAAHELRTPLAAVRTQAEVARGAVTDGERRRALDNVIIGCDRAAHLVEQLLTLARLEPGEARGLRERCDLHALAKTTLAEMAPIAVAKNIELELLGENPAEIQGDSELMRILLRNLVDNALRYSPAGSRVRVETGRDAEGTSLSVTDEGPGIAPAERVKIGQRFYRILGSGEAGSGLGISIVKRIAEMHDARLLFSDGDDGRGLRVELSFHSPQKP